MIVDIFRNGEIVLKGPLYLANSFWGRFKGLMLKKCIGEEEGIFFKNVNRIHTCFMLFPIDVVYFSKDYRVLYIETVYPWKISSNVKGAKHILEVNIGKGKQFNLDEYVEIVSRGKEFDNGVQR